MPELAEEYRDRGMIYLNLECFRAALFDFQAYLKMLPVAKDADAVRVKVVELQGTASRSTELDYKKEECNGSLFMVVIAASR